VLGLSRRLHSLTDGLFDPTVQPLWQHYAELALGSLKDSSDGIARYLDAVGMDRVAVGSDEIRLPPGAAVTLNGIAQGYITDRVADILRLRGWTSVLADLGEVRVLEGKTFDVLVRGTPGTVSIAGGALATSATDATLIGPGSGISHVLDPRTSAPAHRWRTMTVRHASAAVADGLSTALLLADHTQARRILRRLAGASAWATSRSGTTVSL
jgi:thiamine biosynthesis lipoprotein